MLSIIIGTARRLRSRFWAPRPRAGAFRNSELGDNHVPTSFQGKGLGRREGSEYVGPDCLRGRPAG